MKMTRLEREGIVKITRDASLIEQLESLGYKVIGEEDIPEEAKETPETIDAGTQKTITENALKYTAEELKAMLKEKGATVPSTANKSMLEDMAKAEGLI